MNPLKNLHNWFRGLPHKKQYIEVITAALSVPVLLSVVYMNYLSIQEKRHKESITPTPAPSSVTIIREKITESEPQTKISPTDNPECNPDIGPISIINPEEESIVKTNPLEIDIEYKKGEYCSVVWSYRIDGGNWSDYSDKDVQIYNLPSGKKTLELRVKSIVSGDEKNIVRTFTYQNTQEVATPTNMPSPTSIPTTVAPSPQPTP